jgi:microcystin-dependent protein
MSTIKSSNEHLTLNADGSSKDIKFQANGVEKASISSAGLFTSTTIDATKLTGNLPAISGASLTGIVGVLAGLILPFANTSAPTGFLACDGAAVSRSTYATLFTAIGTVWGTGDGSSTFNVPDLRGAFLRGTGSHGTSNMAKGTDFAGAAVGAFENDQAQDHRHQIRTEGGQGIGTNNIGANSSYRQASLANNDFSEWVVAGNPVVNNSQGTPRVGDETRPFNASVLYCIKY